MHLGPYLSPSSWHGVTTAVMGNCGVGFAPVKPQMREWLIQLMEGVEDIPNAALSEGIKVAVGDLPEYMDALERMPRTRHRLPGAARRVAALRDGRKRRGEQRCDAGRNRRDASHHTRGAAGWCAWLFNVAHTDSQRRRRQSMCRAPLPDSTKCLALAGHWATRIAACSR